MRLDKYIQAGPVGIHLNSESPIIEASLVSHDEHGIIVNIDDAGSLTYFPWTSIERLEFIERPAREPRQATFL